MLEIETAKLSKRLDIEYEWYDKIKGDWYVSLQLFTQWYLLRWKVSELLNKIINFVLVQLSLKCLWDNQVAMSDSKLKIKFRAQSIQNM